MSQRERMLGRRVPPTPVEIRVDFSPEADADLAAYTAALQQRELAEAANDGVEEADALVAETKAAVAARHETLLLSALPPAVYDELIGAHPPTDEQRAKNYQWNPDTFGPALLAACIGQDLPDDERMSEKDWIDWASTRAAANGEYVTLVNACLDVNQRGINVHVGKG